MIVLLAFKDVIKNYKKSIVSIIAIILSVILITCTGQVADNIYKSIINDIKKNTGDYYINIESKDKKILNHDFSKKVNYGYQIDYSIASIKGISIYLSSFDDNALQLRSLSLKKGELPKDHNEICIEEWVSEKLGYGMGDKVQLNIDNKIYDFNIVGIINNTSAKAATSGSATESIVSENFGKQNKFSDIYYHAYLKSENIDDSYTEASKISKEIKKENSQIQYNDSLIDAIQNNNTSISVIIISVLIILVATVCIYNIFNISALEKIKQFGTLRCLGLTTSNIFWMIIIEGLILACIAIPLGILIGCLSSEFMFKLAISIMDVGYVNQTISVKYILLAAIFGFIIVLLSTIKPAMNIRKVTPLEALRYSENSTIKGNGEGRLALIVERFLGIKGRLAYENMWVYKSRTRFTITSISISLVIILVLAFYYKNFTYTNKIDEYQKGQFSLSVNNNVSERIDDKYFNEISNIKGVNKVYGFDLFDNAYTKVNIEGLKINKEDEDSLLKIDENTAFIPSTIYGYNDEIFNEIKETVVKGDINKIHEENTILINENPLFTKDKLKYKVGDKIIVDFCFKDGDKYKHREQEFTIGGIVDDLIFNIDEYQDGPDIIMSKDLLNSIVGRKGYSNLNILIDKEYNYRKVEKELEKINNNIGVSNFISYIDEKEEAEKETKNIIILVAIFVSIICIISFLNIKNTITTSLILREKEFSMIRALGTNKLELMMIIVYEGLIWGIISSFISLILGTIITIVMGVNMEEISFSFSSIPWCFNFIIALINVLLCIFISILPVRKLIKKTVVEGLR